MKQSDANRVSNALSLAARAHCQQLYAGLRPDMEDQPYIYHPIRVSMAVSDDPSAKIVALLHDLLEDTIYELPQWLHLSERKAIQLLTRDEDTPYQEYIDQIVEAPGRSGDLAREVKWFDLQDNLSHAPTGDLRDRYTKAIQKLEKVM